MVSTIRKPLFNVLWTVSQLSRALSCFAWRFVSNTRIWSLCFFLEPPSVPSTRFLPSEPTFSLRPNIAHIHRLTHTSLLPLLQSITNELLQESRPERGSATSQARNAKGSPGTFVFPPRSYAHGNVPLGSFVCFPFTLVGNADSRPTLAVSGSYLLLKSPKLFFFCRSRTSAIWIAKSESWTGRRSR